MTSDEPGDVTSRAPWSPWALIGLAAAVLLGRVFLQALVDGASDHGSSLPPWVVHGLDAVALALAVVGVVGLGVMVGLARDRWRRTRDR